MKKLNEFDLQSKTIDWLRFPLAILVIFIHMNPKVDIQNVNYSHFGWYSLYNILGILVSQTIGKIAVPCFFMFSGYLFFIKLKEWNKTIYFTKVKTRFRTLVVPFILFNLAAIILHVFLKVLLADGSVYTDLNNLLENWYRIFWSYTSWSAGAHNIFGQPLSMNYGPYVLQLWFLRDLIVMVVISPIIYYFVKYTKIWGLGILFFFYYTKFWIEMPEFSTRLFLQAFFFFSIGSFFGINKKNIVVSLRKHQIIWIITTLITIFLSVYFYGTNNREFFLPIFTLSGVISVVNITSYFIERGKLKVQETLSKASFFIYCTHCISILTYTHIAIKFCFGKILGAESIVGLFATYIITPLICACVILCIYLFMNRFTPRFLSLFTGNR